MSDLHEVSCQSWDRLLDFLYPRTEVVSQEEVRADLKRSGIDLTSAKRRLHQLVEQHFARAQLAAAKHRRSSALEKLGSILPAKLENVRKGIQDMIGRISSGPQQLAYFHKLEAAATEQDLASLADDLQALVILRDLEKTDGSNG